MKHGYFLYPDNFICWGCAAMFSNEHGGWPVYFTPEEYRSSVEEASASMIRWLSR